MKVLVACEFSGRVRDAFIRRGHEAVSCDLLPSESPGPHYQGDVRKILRDGWDLMVAHPPCYRLTTRGRYRATEAEKREGEEFFMAMVNAPISRIAIENPKGAMSRIYRTPDQIIQPWMFGDKINKATCLWLKDCPPLFPTKDVGPENPVHIDSTTGKRRYSLDYLPCNVDRRRIRSITFQGIADAMAEQWGWLK